jgi:hypothetical protein
MTPYASAQQAVALLKAAIHELLSRHPNGLKTTDVSKALGLEWTLGAWKRDQAAPKGDHWSYVPHR